MKTLNILVLGIMTCLTLGCAKPGEVDGDTAPDSVAALDSVTSEDVARLHLAVAVESDGTQETTPVDASSTDNPKHRSRVTRIIRFLRSPEHRSVVHELHKLVKSERPDLISGGRPTTRAEGIKRLNAIVVFLEENRDRLSDDAQAFLDKVEAYQKKLEEPETVDLN